MTDTRPELVHVVEQDIPFNKLLGIRLESAGNGRAVLVLPVRAELVGDPSRPALHGGVISTLIDTAGGLAAWAALGPDQVVSTVDMRVDYLEPAGLDAPLRAEADLMRKGNRVCHVRVMVFQGSSLVAEGRAVYNIHKRRHEDKA